MMENHNGSQASSSSSGDNKNTGFGHGPPERRFTCRPRMNTNWNDTDHTPTGDVSPTNGFLTTRNNEVLPEELMELLLSYVDLNDLMSVAQVCRLWKYITATRLSFWKSVCVKHGIDWSSIPVHVKNKPNSWIALHSICRNMILQKNLIRNHSGWLNDQISLLGWRVILNGGSGVMVEPTPQGCSTLPPDPFFNDSTSAIVTSFSPVELRGTIRLGKIGLNPSVMKLLLPFKIEYTQMVGARFDSGAQGELDLIFYSVNYQKIFCQRKEFKLQRGSDWTMLRITVVFEDTAETNQLLENTGNLEITLRRKGRRMGPFGHYYGPKFARSCVRVFPMNPDDLAPEPENDADTYLFKKTDLSEMS